MFTKNKNLIYGIIFTLINTFCCVSINNAINPWQILVFLTIISFAAIIIFYDKFETILKTDMTKYLEESHITILFYSIFIILITSIVTIFIPKSSSFIKTLIIDNLPYLASSFSLAIVALVLQREIKLKKSLLDKEKLINDTLDNLNKVSNSLINYNPIFSTRDTFKKSIEKLHTISVADEALRFSLDSVEYMGKYGFVKIDVPFNAYTESLLKIIEKSKSSIIGSYTFRPLNIYNILKSDSNPSTNFALKYLQVLKGKQYSSKIRLVILSKNEILEILKKADTDLKKDGTLKKIPEINWFIDEASSGFTLYWTTDSFFNKNFLDSSSSSEIKKLVSLPNNTISDFAIFDNEFFISYRNLIESENDMDLYAPLLMSWNSQIKNFSKDLDATNLTSKNLYEDFLTLVDKLKTSEHGIKNHIESINLKLSENYGWESDFTITI